MSKPNALPLFSSGYSLIEVITTLSIACILLGLGIPSFQATIQENRMSTAVYTAMTHLHLARSEAVKLGADVVLCPSPDGIDCSDSVRWDTGFIMFIDNNKDRMYSPEEQLLKHTDLSNGSILIRSTPGRKKTVYNPYGYLYGYNLTITFCDMSEKLLPRAIIINNGGRARISDTKPDGTALDCS